MRPVRRETARKGTGRERFRRVLAYPQARFGLFIISVFVLAAIFAPWIAPHDPRAVSGSLVEPPSAEHWLGTDVVGKDVLSGVIFGARVSMAIGLMTGLGVLVLGVALGATAGYFGGRVDSILMRVTEVFQVVPSLVLALVVVSLFGRSLLLISLAITLAIWPQTARIVRAQFLSLKHLDMVAAAQTMGFRAPRIMFKEILPLAMPAVVVQVTIEAGSAILIESGLSFLGLGDPVRPSWGNQLQVAQADLSAIWMSVPPGLAIFLVVLAVNFVGDGMNQAYRPVAHPNIRRRLRKERRNDA